MVRETIGTGTTAKVLDFVYDNSGKPFALTYTDGTAEPQRYYYVLNIQGDVIALMTASREIVTRYTYNAWGKVLSVTNANGTSITSASHIANLNPIRYRGYYYDTETGFYYLQSRYYDPANHRFINADVFASTGTGFLGYNMFAYCNNNPANCIDEDGAFPLYIKGYSDEMHVCGGGGIMGKATTCSLGQRVRNNVRRTFHWGIGRKFEQCPTIEPETKKASQKDWIPKKNPTIEYDRNPAPNNANSFNPSAFQNSDPIQWDNPNFHPHKQIMEAIAEWCGGYADDYRLK